MCHKCFTANQMIRCFVDDGELNDDAPFVSAAPLWVTSSSVCIVCSAVITDSSVWYHVYVTGREVFGQLLMMVEMYCVLSGELLGP